MGDPSAGTWTAHTIAPDISRDGVDQHSDGLELADFNSDGLLDVVGAWEAGDTVSLHFHPGTSSSLLSEGHPSAIGWSRVDVALDIDAAEGVLAQDFDVDGEVDIVSASQVAGGGLTVHWNDDDMRTWTGVRLRESSIVSDRWLEAVAADWSGDGGAFDVLGLPETSRLYVWEQPSSGYRDTVNLETSTGSGVYEDQLDWTRTLVIRARWVMWAAPMDVDGDGDLDALLAIRRTSSSLPDEGFAWAENGTTGGVGGTWTIHYIGEHSANGAANNDRRQAMIGCLGDVDDDGDDDIVAPYLDAGTSTWSHLRWYENDDSATTWTDHAITLPTSLESRDMKGCVLGDIDLDGDLDIALTTASSPTSNVWWVEQTATGWDFHAVAVGGWESKLDDPRVADVDGDGDLDIITSGEESETGLAWHENGRCDP